MLDLNKFCKKKRTIFQRMRIYWKLYQRHNLQARKKCKIDIKQPLNIFIKLVIYLLLLIIGIIGLLVIAGILLWFSTYFQQNFTYSIAMPKIVGQFSYDKEYNTISINGLESLINDKSASLGYTEIFCMIDNHKCVENRLSISNFDNKIMMFPYNNEYKINYYDHNKLIIYDENHNITGEIDLLTKTITFTTISILTNETRKVEILTDNDKILELEKEIIHKYLKVKLFQ